MRTTINISDALLSDLKRKAAEDQTTFRKTVESVLQKGLATPTSGNRVSIEVADVGVKSPYLGMSMNQLYDQLEVEDLQKVAES